MFFTFVHIVFWRTIRWMIYSRFLGSSDAYFSQAISTFSWKGKSILDNRLRPLANCQSWLLKELAIILMDKIDMIWLEGDYVKVCCQISCNGGKKVEEVLREDGLIWLQGKELGRMSAPQVAGAAAGAVTGAVPYWRAAGLSYVAYANACAAHLRKCLKEPFKTQSATREQVHYKFSNWEDGVPQPSSKSYVLACVSRAGLNFLISIDVSRSSAWNFR